MKEVHTLSDHYFTSNPSVNSKPLRWSFPLNNHTLQFTSDSGVFSKKEVDFGSRLLIESFRLPEVDGRVLDVGCGYGPIGLAIAKSHPSRFLEMIDVNERALELAKENAKLNSVKNVSVFKSDLFSAVETKDFSAVLSNPPIRAGKKVVHEILTESFHHLRDGGELWIVIQKKQGAPSAIEKLQTVFSEVEVVEKKKGYYIIKSKKG